MIVWNGELYHYGVPRRSGRYKWGSGENPYHHGLSVPRRAIRKYDRLQSKLDTNHRGQDKYNNKMNNFLNRRRTAKADAYASKASALERKAMKTKERLRNDKKVSNRSMNKLAKYEYYKNSEALHRSKTAKVRGKLAKLESDEARIIAKMNKIDDKLMKKYVKQINSVKKHINGEVEDMLAEGVSYEQTKKYLKSLPQIEEVKQELKRVSELEKTVDPDGPKSGRFPWGESARTKSEDEEVVDNLDRYHYGDPEKSRENRRKRAKSK